ncbi:MAG: N-acetyltransferase [Burkholderiales bacterium]|nr:N-acetyltransferase [Burkholderiales bacterium]
MIQIHPTATVDKGASIGVFTSIWHYAHVESTAVVGENCSLGMSTYVAHDAIVGNGCRLGNGVSVFSRIELGDFVFCAPFMVFTHIAFPRASVNRHEIFKKTVVGRGVTLGANSTVIPGLTVGEGSFLAAGSALTKDCKDWALMIGTPARHVGWVSAYGEKIPLPLAGEGEWQCKHTGDFYLLRDSMLSRRPGPSDILKYVPGVKLERIKATDSPR